MLDRPMPKYTIIYRNYDYQPRSYGTFDTKYEAEKMAQELSEKEGLFILHIHAFYPLKEWASDAAKI